MKNNFFAEIVESHLENFTAQSWAWNKIPEFGSLVEVETEDFFLFGVVFTININSTDQSHYTFTYKKTHEELMHEQPQIFEFIRILFTVKIICFTHKDRERFFYVTPPVPPYLHSFVKITDLLFYKKVFTEQDFIRIIYDGQLQASIADNLFITIITNMAKQKILSYELFKTFYKEIASAKENDYSKLRKILKQIEKIFPWG